MKIFHINKLKHKGFTIIELVVVLSITSFILIGINQLFNNFVNQTKEVERRIDEGTSSKYITFKLKDILSSSAPAFIAQYSPIYAITCNNDDDISCVRDLKDWTHISNISKHAEFFKQDKLL